MDLYGKMGEELRDLFKDLFRPDARNAVEIKMRDILKTAALIGGKVAEEAEMLHNDVVRYLKHPKDPKAASILKEHAIRLEQETREI
ncbi:MAG: hypothetical protein K1X28_02310 [Parachlamydiales bacterium]|nr:hypothetical protein [Parachlamydiales bacterium]